MAAPAPSIAFDRALLSPEYLADPYAYYAALREHDPICWSDRLNAWVLTRYRDVRAALTHPSLVSGQRVRSYVERLEPGMIGELQALFYQLGKWIGNMDPPDHRRLRKLVDLAFTARMVEGLRPAIERLTQELLDRTAGQGGMDFIEDFAYPLPAIVIAQVLGVPPEARERFMRWSQNLTAYLGAGRFDEAAARLASSDAAEMTAFFSDLADQRRVEPRDDLISRLVKIEQEGDRLTLHELISMCGFLIVAGHETTMALLSNGLLALLRQPGAAQRLRDDPALIRSAVEEFLRYDSSIQHQTRVAAQELEFGGRRILEGQRVMPFLGAANRDPAQFPEPDRLDLARSPNAHVAFGHGIHHCLGAPLARLEAQVAFPMILRAFPNLRLATAAPEYRRNTSNRNPTHLPVTF